MLESVCRVKRFHFGGKRFADDEEVETEVRKWLRQQSKDFYAAGFGALVKWWDKCISVGEVFVNKYIFSRGSNVTCFTFYIHLCHTYSLSLLLLLVILVFLTDTSIFIFRWSENWLVLALSDGRNAIISPQKERNPVSSTFCSVRHIQMIGNVLKPGNTIKEYQHHPVWVINVALF
jgi:hypothetical protein